MEAVPRLPMICFDIKTSPEPVQFGPQLKQYIANFYNEDPESYNQEIQNLESLRGAAVRPTIDSSGCQILNKYYCQLHFLKYRFPMEENQDAAVYFTWKDSYTNVPCGLSDIRFELACILYNIGALHTQLGAADFRTTPEGMKKSCSHFQCAAWAFETIKNQYYQFIPYISSLEFLQYMCQVCLAQAQECILEKSMMDNRKATIISKIAVQVVDYYKRSLSLLSASGEDGGIKELIGSKLFKEWQKYLSFKIAYHKCIALLFQGQQAEEQQKMGERVAFYQAACDQLDEARKLGTNLKQQKEITEAIAFTSDVVEGKRKAAKNENEFIYHEEVPDKSSLQEVKGASLVKGIPFNVNDAEVSGPDIFARLVPMETHEASSLYSEKKAQMLRNLGELVEAKDQALVEFMSSLQLDVFTQMRQATGLSQELVDRAAALSARPTATQDLVNAMGKLSNSYHEVESMLTEINQLLQEEEKNEKEYQSLMGKRPPSIIGTDLSREAAKYREAHTKANDSNQNLHKAMMAHVANLKILMKPLSELQKQIPSVEFPNPHINESCVKEIEHLISKVEKMRNQRAMLWSQFREALHQDDITAVLVTRHNQPLDEVFQQELKKHQDIANLIEQNCVAQENILKAFVDVYASSTQTRRYLQEIITKRHTTVNALITSFDTYEDLVSKAAKGIEFYEKLEGNVSKLLQRIRSACKVQQEEREQFMSKNIPKENDSNLPHTPKLKDFLDTRKRGSGNSYYPPVNNQEPVQPWPTTVRPAPLGSEMNNDVTTHRTHESQPSLNERFSNLNTYQYSDKHAATMVTDSYQTISSAEQNVPTSHGLTYPYVPQNEQSNYDQYRQNEYATSVHLNNIGPAANYIATYSSPTVEMKSSQSAQVGFGVASSQVQFPYGTAENVAGIDQNPNAQAHGSSSSAYGHTQNQSGSYMYNDNQAANYGYNAGNKASASNYQSVYGYGGTQPADTGNENPYANASVPMGYAPIATPPTSQITGYGYNPAAQPVSSTNQHVPGGYSSTSSTFTQSTSQIYGYNSGNSASTSGFDSSQSQPSSYEYNSGFQPPSQTAAYGYGGATQQTSQPTGYGYDSGSTNQTSLPTSLPSQPSGYPNPSNPLGSSQQGYSNTLPAYQNTYGYDPSQYSSANQVPVVSAQIAPAVSSSNQNFDYNNQYSYGYNNSQTVGSVGNPNVPNYGYTQGYYGYEGTQPSGAAVQSYEVTPVANSSSQNVNYQQIPQAESHTSLAANTSSNMDLLTGLDFSVNQAPLLPQPKIEPPVATAEQPKADSPSMKTVKSDKIETPPPLEKVINRKPLNNSEVKKLFQQESIRFEKLVDDFSEKSTPTDIDAKWKEIHESDKKAISVARCYPLKNRFADILPYDHSRVELVGSKDDYINASHITDIAYYSPNFIITQAPLQSTFGDFWTMVREQRVELILCLQADQELGNDIYFPTQKGNDLTFNGLVISLISCTEKSSWIERIVSVSEKRDSRPVIHLQFTGWPPSLFPTSPIGFVAFISEALNLFMQQRSSTHPILIHCASGIGRSGVACLLMSTILEVTSNPVAIPELTVLATKMCEGRKNLLRDKEHLKFAYEALLVYIKQLTEGPSKVLKEAKPAQKEVKTEMEVKQPVDPLSTLDPYWANKRGG